MCFPWFSSWVGPSLDAFAARTGTTHLPGRVLVKFRAGVPAAAQTAAVAESLPAQKELMVRLIEHFVLLKGDTEERTT